MKIRIVLYGAAAFMFVISAAKSAPVTLACGYTAANRVGDGFVHFDESAGTAGQGTADAPRYDVTAAFSETEIRWKWDLSRPEAGTDHYTYVLSRTTGELDEILYNPNLRMGNGTTVLYCAPVQKAF